MSWIDKEEDAESDLGDFGVRKYDDGVGRFMSIDPLWEKYYSVSPYHYAGNNPLKITDPSGKDYDVIFDDATGTATIQATYYANEDSYSSAEQAVKSVNALSGQFTYTRNDKEYTVNFDLKAVKVENPESELRQDIYGRVIDEETFLTRTSSNTYSIVPDDPNNASAGITAQNVIEVEKSFKDHPTVGFHEVLHSLGVDHALAGVMTTTVADKRHSAQVFQGQIDDMITRAVNGVRDYTGLGRGTVK